jgi:hypothetical protein
MFYVSCDNHLGEFMSIEFIEKGNVSSLCSLRATRRVLESYWKWDISENTVKETNELFNRMICAIAEGIANTQLKRNERLCKFCLRPKYRLTILKNFSDVLYKLADVISMGATGESNNDTVVSDKQLEEI